MITQSQAEKIAQAFNEAEEDQTFATITLDPDCAEEEKSFKVVIPIAGFEHIRIAEQITGGNVRLEAVKNMIHIFAY